jgi:predicted metal-dependent hydrolase
MIELRSVMAENEKIVTASSGYVIRKSKRARGLRISVYCDGSCVVTAPVFLEQSAIEKFVSAKSAWIAKKLREFMPFKPIAKRTQTRAHYRKHKEEARLLAAERLEYFNRFYGFKVGRIAIRKQKSRWGSCSAKGNLNFNYKIALLPPHLSDYVIVHELCHLGEFNHSENFWNLVAKTIPQYKEARMELRRQGLAGVIN